MPGPKREKEVNLHKASIDTVLERLMTLLYDARERLDSSEEDFTFLSSFLESNEFRSLVQVHSRIGKNGKDRPLPYLTDGSDVLENTTEDIASFGTSPECYELLDICNKPHFRALFMTHDQVAQRDFVPNLPDIPSDDLEGDEETIKIVQLVKSNEPLGATIKYDEKVGSVVIARIMHGGAADRSGLIHVGDEVQEVNGVSVKGKTPTDVLHILQNMDGTLTFKLIPTDGLPHAKESRVRMRVHFDYNPIDDKHNPCRDAGLGFRRGDVIHVVDQTDQNWWQARKEGDRNMRAGLVPSRLLQERRILSRRNASPLMMGDDLNQSRESTDIESGHVSPVCQIANAAQSPGSRKSKKAKKVMYDVKINDDFDRDEIPTYEEVAKYYPRAGLCRPIILIGPPGIGRNELKRRLIAMYPDHYRTSIPHTTRERKSHEVNGVEYYFIDRNDMEAEIDTGKFIEHGEYKGNLYGTALDTVQSIINAGYVCILSPHPQALKMLRTSELKPFVIYIKPPSFDQLKETRHSLHARSAFDKESSREFTDDEFRDILNSATRIEFLYGHCFDATIVNDDLQDALSELMIIARKAELEPQWVPANWVQ